MITGDQSHIITDVEHWAVIDNIALLQQMGATPT